MSSSLPATVYENQYDNAPKPAAADWPDDFLQHEERAEKDGPLWSPALFPAYPTVRRAAGVATLSALVLDFDTKQSRPDPAEILLRFQEFELVYHTSFSHDPDAPAFRLILPFAEPVDPRTYERIWKWAEQRAHPFRPDPACKNVDRFYYTPTARPGAERQAFHWPGDRRLSPSAAGVATSGPAPSAQVGLFSQVAPVHRTFAAVENIDAIESRCAFMRHARDDAANLPENEWHAALSIWVRCTDGDELAHRRSKPYAGYSQVETQARLDRLKHFGPATCQKVKDESEACRGCTLKITSPVLLGKVAGEEPEAAEVRAEAKQARSDAWLEQARATYEAACAAEDKAKTELESAKAHLTRQRKHGTEEAVAEAAAQKVAAERAYQDAKLDRERAEKVAKAAIRRASGDAAPDDLPDGADVEVWGKLDFHPKEDRPRPTRGNLRTILEHDPDWRERLAYDTFHARVCLDRQPLEDTRITKATTDIEYTYKLATSSEMVGEVVTMVASERPFHPVRDYLATLEWDGTPRVADFLETLFGAEAYPHDPELLRDIGVKFLVSCVARVMEPGCDVQTMLILAGPQGAGKSRGLRELVRPPGSPQPQGWFSDSKLDVGEKDAAQLIRGRWIYELSELDSFKKYESSRIKMWISSSVDNVRLPYARHPVDLLRETVLVGTTNQDFFLDDPTGARRFMCARVTRCDLAGIAAARDQLWAEALALYAAGTPWWWDAAGVERLNKANAEYRESHVWEDIIRDGLRRQKMKVVTITQVLLSILGRAPGDFTKRDKDGVADCLRALGCKIAPRGTDRVYKYLVPEDLLAPEPERATATTQSSGSKVVPFATQRKEA